MDLVLLVEDIPVQAELARVGLEAQGFSVTVPGDGVEAPALALEHPSAAGCCTSARGRHLR